MDCHEVAELLQQFLDGELDDQRTARLTAHLDVCRQCGMEADVYRYLRDALRSRRRDVDAAAVARLRSFGERLAQ